MMMAAALALGGWLAVSLSLPRHQRQLFKVVHSRPRLRSARFVGISLLALSLAVAMRTVGWSVGPVEWLAYGSVSAFVLALLLSYAPSLAVVLTVAALAAAALAG